MSSPGCWSAGYRAPRCRWAGGCRQMSAISGRAMGSQVGDDGWAAVPVRRKLANLAFWGLGFLALAVVVVPTVWLAGGIIVRAVPHFSFSVLVTRTSGTTGGLEQAV